MPAAAATSVNRGESPKVKQVCAYCSRHKKGDTGRWHDRFGQLVLTFDIHADHAVVIPNAGRLDLLHEYHVTVLIRAEVSITGRGIKAQENSDPKQQYHCQENEHLTPAQREDSSA